jgi:heme exporter protein CcmD
MGGYAQFVWPSYALTLLVIALNIHWARRALSQAKQAALRRMAGQGATRRARAP